MKRLLAVLSILSVGVGLLYAANTCTKTDFECYQSGPSQNLNTQWRVDSGGNFSATGNGTITGNLAVTGTQTQTGNVTSAAATIFTPPAVVVVSSNTTITPSQTYILVGSTNANVTIGQPALAGQTYPQLSTATAVNGQYVVLGATSSVSTVTISTMAAVTGQSAIYAAATTRLLDNKKRMGLIFDSSINEWLELWYGNNP